MAAAQLQALRVQSDPAAVEVHHIILDRIAAFTGQVEMAGLPSGVSLTFLTPPDGARGGR